MKNIFDVYNESEIKEGLLNDLEDNLKTGDKMMKEYKLVEKELDYLRNLCSDISNWNGNDYEAVSFINNNASGVVHKYQIFIKFKHLLKYFNLSGKNLFLSLTFKPGDKDWTVSFITTNSIKAKKWSYKTFSGDAVTELKVSGFQQCIHYTYIENSFIPKEGSRSKYTPKQFIDKFIIPKFKDMNTFKKEIIDEFEELERERVLVKWHDTINI